MNWVRIIEKILDILKSFESTDEKGEEKKLKHLEFIQATIVRMGANSFLIKNWCITLITSLTTAVLVLSEDDIIKTQIVSVLIIPVILFWVLDGYFLSQERKFRKLYSKISKTQPAQINFSMNTSEFDGTKENWFFSMLSITKLLFYIPIITILLLILYILQYV